MAKILYGDGTLYGEADALYGRISSELLAAQAEYVRETGLIVEVGQSSLNAWEYFAGETLANSYRANNAGIPIYDLNYWSYRGSASICLLSNGTIVRVRIGDGTQSDRQVYVQEITDPTVASQWTSWSLLYSGTHYSITVVPATSSTYHVYHSKSDGLYRNNSKIWEPSAAQGKAHSFIPIDIADPVCGFVRVIRHDETKEPNRPKIKRTTDLYYFEDVVNDAETWDKNNFRWFRPQLAAITLPDGRIARFQSGAIFHSPREGNSGQAIWLQFQNSKSDLTLSPPYQIRGIGGGGGLNWFGKIDVQLMSDGYYYLWLRENHQVARTYESTTDVGAINTWSRSKDLMHWSEPVVGPPVTPVGKMIEHSGYVWAANNGAVWRRPLTTITHDISNYVPEVNFDLPRDNQPGTGEVLVANPAGVNDFLLDATGSRIVIKPGIRTSTGQYEFEEQDLFWIKAANRVVEGAKNRISLTIGNVWDRLDTQMKDVYNFVGLTEWEDWKVGKRNEKFNYFFLTDTKPTLDDHFRLITRGYVLWTGWKGFNFDVEARFSSYTGNPALIGRYIDKNNHLKLRKNGSGLQLIEVYDGNETVIDSWSTGISGAFTVRWVMSWSTYRIWVDGVEYGNPNDQYGQDFNVLKSGYVGFQSTTYKVAKFKFKDLEFDLQMQHVIKTALAAADVHDLIVTGGITKAYALIWGPQTDVTTYADGLRTAMESEKLQLVWRNGSAEIGIFNDPTVVKELQDRIIETEHTEEEKRRVNYAMVEGNEHSWISLDTADTYRKARTIVGYFDLPDLLTQAGVKERAREEIRKSTQGSSPRGSTPLFFDIQRMDHINWIDNVGNDNIVRIEGIAVDINQGEDPFQRMNLDTSLISDDPSEFIDEEIIYEDEPEAPVDDE